MAEVNTTRLDIPLASILKVIMTILGFILLYVLKDIVIVLIFAIIIASAMAPFAAWLESKGIPRLFGVLTLYLLVFGLLILLVSQIIPFISDDLLQLTSIFPKIVEKLSSSLDTVQQGAPRYFDFVSEIQNFLDVLTSYLQQFSQSALSFVVSIFGGVFSFVAIIIISFYLAVMKNGVESFLISVAPTEYEDYVIDLWKRTELKIGRWLQGQLLLGLIVGLLVYIGLSIIGVRFALILGILSMVLEIVPVAGPVLAAIPGVSLAFLQDPSLGLWVLVFYTAVQQFEGHVLTPIVLGKTIGLNPVVVILALLVGAKLAGMAGIIIGVPLATVLVEVIDSVARRKESRRTIA